MSKNTTITSSLAIGLKANTTPEMVHTIIRIAWPYLIAMVIITFACDLTTLLPFLGSWVFGISLVGDIITFYLGYKALTKVITRTILN